MAILTKVILIIKIIIIIIIIIKIIIFYAQQSIEDQDLLTDFWPHFHLFANTGEIASSQFRGDVRSACRILRRY